MTSRSTRNSNRTTLPPSTSQSTPVSNISSRQRAQQSQSSTGRSSTSSNQKQSEDSQSDSSIVNDILNKGSQKIFEKVNRKIYFF